MDIYHREGDIDSSPALGADGTIYVGSDDNNLYALTDNGRRAEVDNMPPDMPITSSPALGADGTIYVGSNDDNLYALTDNGVGSVYTKWTYATQGDISSSPAIGADGTLYVGSIDNNLYAFKPVTSDRGDWWMFHHDVQHTGRSPFTGPAIPQLAWKYATGNAIYSSPALGADGTIYVGSNDDNLYALTASGALKWKYATGRRDLFLPGDRGGWHDLRGLRG